MYRHDLKGHGFLNPSRVELWVCSTSVKVVLKTKISIANASVYESLSFEVTEGRVVRTGISVI